MQNTYARTRLCAKMCVMSFCVCADAYVYICARISLPTVYVRVCVCYVEK